MSGPAFEICIITESDLLASDYVAGRKTYNDLFTGDWNLGVGYTRMVEARVKEEYAMNWRVIGGLMLFDSAKEFSAQACVTCVKGLEALLRRDRNCCFSVGTDCQIEQVRSMIDLLSWISR
jgi:hypothetical protein